MNEILQALVPYNNEYDTPWKDALTLYFREFMEFFFPEAAAEIRWSAGYEFLDAELQQIVRDAELGKRLADKLVRVELVNGASVFVLVHIEIQGQYEADFAKRMYIYNYRIFDKYDLPVASFALLTDDNSAWKPHEFVSSVLGSTAKLEFPTAKLLEVVSALPSFDGVRNPFAIIGLAHLKARETRTKPLERYEWKLYLVKILYANAFSKQNILEILRFLDWLLFLPKELEQQFRIDTSTLEKPVMPYITSWERDSIIKGLEEGFEKGMKEGMQQGMQQGMQKVSALVSNLLLQGFTVEQLVQMSEFSQEEILTIQREMQKKT